MRWSEVRKDYPNMWVVIESMSSNIKDDEETIEEVSVINSYKDSKQAYLNYRQIHKQQPERNYLFASTQNEKLKVKIQYWAGVRGKA